MKKIWTLFALLVLVLRLSAQVRHNYGFYYTYEDKTEQENAKKNKVAQQTVITKWHTRENKTIKKYDAQGHATSYHLNKNRDIKTVYGNDDQEKEFSIYKKNKLVERDSFLWDRSKLLHAFYFDKHNRISCQERYAYDSTYMTEYVLQELQKGKFVEKRKSEIEYYPDYSFKKITYYKNGKAEYYSVFDCNPAGENHKVSSDSSHNCIKYDVDSLGNKMKITTWNNKKNGGKTIEYSNPAGQVIARKQYDLKNRIGWEAHYLPGTELTTLWIYYKKGKESYRWEKTYDESKKCVSMVAYKKKKMDSTTKNVYNTKGLIEKSEEYSTNNKKKTEISYVYEYY